MSVPDPSSTEPFPVERHATPHPAPRAREAPRARAADPSFRFSPLSFALGLLVGITFASCLSGLAFVFVVLSA